MKILGLIPARGGSKGVPRKNIKNLCGKPLIYYSINAALNSKYLTDVIVSTDDKEIASISLEEGALVPFLRPKKFSTDKSPTIDTVVHTIKKLKKIGKLYDAVCLVQPTNPLINNKIIDLAVQKFQSKNIDSLISVRPIPHQYHPDWAFIRNSEGNLILCNGKDEIIPRRQDLSLTYYRDGIIYLTRTNIILNKKSLYGKKIGYIDFQNESYLNIDTIDDWIEAEHLLSKQK